MPELTLPTGLAGAVAGPFAHEVDARWLMAYAAGLGESAAAYLDTARPGGILAHPLFPVAYEWPVAVAARAALPPEVAVRGVHVTNDLVLHRLPRAGDRLATTASVTAVRRHRAGALVLNRFATVDAGGAPVSTTEAGTLYRDVACEPAEDGTGGAPFAAPPAAPAPAVPAWSAEIRLPPTLGHVYTECARIWNPIHTDRAVARAAGLPDVILHGTATLALAVSEVLRREGGDPLRVRRIRARFGAMVLLPSTLAVQGLGAVGGPDGRWVAFQALTDAGGAAVRDGRLLLAP